MVLNTNPLFWMEHEDYFFNNRTKPHCEVKKFEGGYEVEAHFPGFKKENIKMELEDRILSIDAWRGPQDNIITYQRSWKLEEGIKMSDISANYVEGLLTITILRPEKIIPEKKQIIIKLNF